jgi:hypothetical protein
MSFFGVSLRNGVSLGLGTVPALSNPPLLYRLAPSLLLQFAGAETLDSRVTFTRTTTATRTNSSGLIESVAINGPRFDYNPITLASNGLLIEEQRVNLLLQSEAFDSGSWGKQNVTVTPNAIVAPDSTTTADLILDTTTAGVEHYISQAVSIATNQPYTQSIYVKASTTPAFTFMVVAIGSSSITSSIRFSQIAGVYTPDSTTNGLITTAAATSVGNGWYRCSVTYVLDGTVTTHQMRIYPNLAGIYTGTGIGTYFWGAQTEVGAFPTSYIPTVASQVTRTADVATMTGTNFSSWYNATEGTMYGNFNSSSNSGALDGSGGGRGLATINDGTGSNRFRFAVSLQTFQTTVSGSTVVSITPVATTAANTNYKFAAAFKVNDYQAARNGVLGTVATSGVLPIVNQLQIGFSTSTGGILNGTIKQITYYPRRLSNAELQAITS